LLLCGLQISDAVAQPAPQAEDFSNTTFGKIMIAVVSAIMSLIVGYILLYLKERREPTKRISYNAEFRKGMLGIEEQIAKDVKFMYKGTPVDKISYVKCDVANTGSSVIRNEHLRFEYPKGMEILDYEIEPTPPKEAGLALTGGVVDSPNERSFTITQFNRQQILGFNFVLKGEATGGLKLFGKNEDEDVDIVARETSSFDDETKILERFIFIILLTFFVPHVLVGIPDLFVLRRLSVGEILDWLFWIVVTIIVLRYLPTAANIIARAMVRFKVEAQPTISVRDMNAKGSIIIATQVSAEQTTSFPAGE
jgi:hypothetical protein